MTTTPTELGAQPAPDTSDDLGAAARPESTEARRPAVEYRPVDPNASIFVAGHRGLVGSAICRRLAAGGYSQVITAPRTELDLRDQAAVHRWFDRHRPDYVYLVAGTVGGIMANSTRPAEFLYDNMMIHATVIEAARRTGRRPSCCISGSACVYPRLSPQPIPESRAPHRAVGADERGLLPWPKSPGCGCVSSTGSSTGATSSPQCRPTSTARTTTSISSQQPCPSSPDAEVPRGQTGRVSR